MMLIDTHSHIYLDDFQQDRDAMLQRCRDTGVQKILLPNIDQESIEPIRQLCAQHPEMCYPMMGIHPCYINEDSEQQLRAAEQELHRQPCVAVGEVGLDYHWDKQFIPQQQAAFDQQIGWAIDLRLPVVIHSREAMADCIRMVRERQQGHLSGVFHCFSGSYEEACQIIDLGFYLGIGGVSTYKTCRLTDFLQRLPADRIVLETDSPYLPPVPFRGQRNESSYIVYVARKVADILQCSEAEVAQLTTANALRLFPRINEQSSPVNVTTTGSVN